MIAARDDAEAAAGAFMDVGEPAGILLLEDQPVVGLFGAELVQPDLHRTMIVVELHIEEGLAIERPHHAAIGLLDHVVEIAAGGPVTHANGEIFRALDVGTPGFQRMIG